MPVYTFENTKGKQYDITMPSSNLDQYLKDHPNHRQVFRMNIVDPVGAGITRPPEEFLTGVVGKAARMPGANKNALYKRWHPKREI